MKKLTIPFIVVTVLLVACGGSDSDTPEEATARAGAQATIDAARANAEELGVTDQTLAYARQWCDPINSIFDEMSEFEPDFATAEGSDDFTAFLGLMGQLVGPMERFKEDLDDMNPPDDYKEYHAAFQEEIAFALEGIKAMETGGLFAAFALGDEPPTAEQPPEFEAALAIECGDQFVDIFSDETFNLFESGTGGTDFGFGTNEEPCEGAGCSRSDPIPLGARIEMSDGQTVRVLEANLNAEAQVLAENDFIDPPAAGKRMLLIEVEVTYDGAGDETLFVSSGQFSLTGSNNVVYDTFDEGVSCGFLENDLNAELFSGGTAQGQLCFQYPENETDLILIVEPTFSFGSESRRYLALE